jgi:hypothetical protein
MNATVKATLGIELRRRIEAEARRNDRSLSEEIRCRLEKSLVYSPEDYQCLDAINVLFKWLRK